MKLYQILETEIQSDFRIVFYNSEHDIRYVISRDDKNLRDCTVRYLYVENGMLYIELDEYESMEAIENIE